jgi:hypothetical protein
MLIDVGCAVAYLGRGGLAQPLLLSYALGCVALDVSRALNVCVGTTWGGWGACRSRRV